MVAAAVAHAYEMRGWVVGIVSVARQQRSGWRHVSGSGAKPTGNKQGVAAGGGGRRLARGWTQSAAQKGGVLRNAAGEA